MALVRTVLFYLWFAVVCALFLPFLPLMCILNFERRCRLYFQQTKLILLGFKYICGIKHEIIGTENIPDTPGIVMSKHQSIWETGILQKLFVPQVFVLKRELLWIPIYGFTLLAMQPIALNRQAGRKSIRKIVKEGCLHLQKKRWVIIFPEGTRTRVDAPPKYLPGGGLLAQQSGCDITPIAHNSGLCCSAKSFCLKAGKTTMVIGPVIKTEGKTAKAITREVENWIERTQAQLPKG